MYSVRVKKEGDASIEQHLNTTETFYNITNLSVHTEYTFEVRVKNQIGESPEATVTERTLSDSKLVFFCFGDVMSARVSTFVLHASRLCPESKKVNVFYFFNV